MERKGFNPNHKNNNNKIDPNSDKATWTALIISPPQDKWDNIQEIRKVHDKAYQRWMPHINIAFPFVKPENFDQFIANFQEDFQNLKKFRIDLKKFRYFNHGKNSVMYLEPETDDNQESIKNILKTIMNKRPDLNDQNNKSEQGYTPHLTCGTFPTNQIQGRIEEFQKHWEEISFEVEEVLLIQREGKDNPFYVSKTLKLGQ